MAAEGARPIDVDRARRETPGCANVLHLEMEQRRLTEIVRASVHCDNTEAEIDRFCELIADVAPRLRQAR